jgi:hypothetical protein
LKRNHLSLEADSKKKTSIAGKLNHPSHLIPAGQIQQQGSASAAAGWRDDPTMLSSRARSKNSQCRVKMPFVYFPGKIIFIKKLPTALKKVFLWIL